MPKDLVAKVLPGIASKYISKTDNIEALVELQCLSDNTYELANLDFYTHTLNVKFKKLALDIKLLQSLPNGTKLLQNLLNGKNLLQIY